MRWFAFALVLLVAGPVWAGAGWYAGTCNTNSANSTTGAPLTAVEPSYQMQADSTACFMHIDVAGGGAEAVTDSATIGVLRCRSVTVSYCRVTGDGVLATYRLYTSAVSATAAATKTLPKPICMDSDGIPGLDCTLALNGDCGDDADGDGTARNQSLYWGFGPPAGPYIWLDEIVAPSDGKTATVQVSCGAS